MDDASAGLPELREIAGVRPPDTRLVREAYELARSVSTPMLFNHVMRSYFFGRLLASAPRVDEEVIFLSAVLHDLGLTDYADGPRRFEIEGADAARAFVSEHGVADERAWLVWDTIALHTFDLNQYKQAEAQAVQAGIVADVVGPGLHRLDPSAVSQIVAAYPRLAFKRDFFALLLHQAERKPQSHTFHPTHMIAHHCCGGVPIPDARPMIEAAPFAE